MSDHGIFDLIKAGLASSARDSLADRISSVVAAIIPNRVVYWVLVRISSIDAKRNGLSGKEMADRPIGVIAARLRHEIVTGQVP